jgi:4-aminobutyrate aminotransferase / (S)-3-amino-2-methylpropionate transaminase / 5-aminovalerate transaminase
MALPEQRRILKTPIPGPTSVKLHKRRSDELAAGLGVTLPVFVDEAGGGVLVDVDGNHLINLASGIAVTSVGASDPDVARRVAEQAGRFTHAWLPAEVRTDSPWELPRRVDGILCVPGGR